MIAIVPDRDELAQHGISVRGHVFWHPTTSQLYEHALARGDARLAEGGPLVVDTGEHTGRSPKDKFVVREPGSEDRIWWGDVNAEISEEHFEQLREKVAARLSEGDVYVDRRVRRRRSRPSNRGARDHREPVARALREDALHRPDGRRARRDGAAGARPACAVGLGRSRTRTARGRRRSSASTRRAREVVIGGTFYAGEIKKSIFTVMNDRLPLEGVFPMHCSANLDDDGPRRGVLRALGHGEDDALRRSRAPPHRRRRARLVGRRRLQLRGRLLRQGDPALGGGRAADLRDDARVRHRARERRHGRARRPRSRRRLEDREHARRVQARADRERAPGEAGRASRARSSSSPPTPSGSSRRSRG